VITTDLCIMAPSSSYGQLSEEVTEAKGTQTSTLCYNIALYVRQDHRTAEVGRSSVKEFQLPAMGWVPPTRSGPHPT